MGELADATLKGQDEEMQDAIGDVVVCLINLGALHEWGVFYQYFDLVHKLGFNWMGQLRKRTPAAQVMVAVSELGKLAEAKGNDRDMGMVDAIGNVTVCLDNLCILKGWTLEECVEKAWEQIKDRRGTLLPNGCFVKEEEAK
jgi:hypothetical protein